jgi:hypothetical protein
VSHGRRRAEPGAGDTGPREPCSADGKNGSPITPPPTPVQQRSGPRLRRETFRTSRLLDFASEKELIAQIGHRPSQWPLAIVKELTDNALDAAEEADIAPEVTITIDKTGITVADNGPGIPGKTVEGVLDFAVRTSSREAYVSPTRGAQGNALKTIVAIPFVRDGERGSVEIEARGMRHEIEMSVDRVRQEPVVRHRKAASKVETGTVVRIPWKGLSQAQFDDPEAEDDLEFETVGSENSPRSIADAKGRFLQIATGYAWLNPHAIITVDWYGKRTSIAATDLAWRKWKPSDPTSPHWYRVDHLERLIGAYLKHDADSAASAPCASWCRSFAA